MLKYHFLKKDYLIFRGSERLDLINRLSTNKVDKLQQYQGLKTILTNDKGRFIDLLSLYTFENLIFVECSFGYSEKIKAHLDKFTILDDFQAEIKKDSHISVLFFGEDAERLSKEIFSVDLTNLSNIDFIILKENNYDLIISKNDDNFKGFTCIVPIEAKEEFEKKYFSKEMINDYKYQEVDDKLFNTLRIEYGIPVVGNELNDHINPLECDLQKYISFSKGCYIGQEVIARMDTYDKISKHIVGLRFDSHLRINNQKINKTIFLDNNECGQVTSTTQSKKFGNIGLGFVKTAYLDFTKQYYVKSDSQSYNCKLNKLPF